MRLGLGLTRYLAAALATCVLLSSACIPRFGDPTHSVFIRNATAQSVTAFAFDRDPRFGEELAPGETWHATWMYPITAGDRRKVRVKADAEDGTRIFCADFGYEDLTRLDWKIELMAGRDDCTS